MEDTLIKPLLHVYLMLIGKTKGGCGEWSQEETYGETLTRLITATKKKKEKKKTWMKKHRPQAAARLSSPPASKFWKFYEWKMSGFPKPHEFSLWFW